MIEKPVFENAEQMFKVYGEPQISSWWQTMKAVLFGTRLQFESGDFLIIGYSYGGVLHITGIHRQVRP